MRKFTNEPEDGTIWSHKLVTPLLLPLSLLWDIFFYWKTQLNLLTGRGRESHATGVARVQVTYYVQVSSIKINSVKRVQRSVQSMVL